VEVEKQEINPQIFSRRARRTRREDPKINTPSYPDLVFGQILFVSVSSACSSEAGEGKDSSPLAEAPRAKNQARTKDIVSRRVAEDSGIRNQERGSRNEEPITNNVFLPFSLLSALCSLLPVLIGEAGERKSL